MKSINEYLINKHTKEHFDFFDMLQDHDIIYKHISEEDGGIWNKYQLKLLDDRYDISIYIHIDKKYENLFFGYKNDNVFVSASAYVITLYNGKRELNVKNLINKFDINKTFNSFIVNKKNTELIIDLLEEERFENK